MPTPKHLTLSFYIAKSEMAALFHLQLETALSVFVNIEYNEINGLSDNTVYRLLCALKTAID